MRSIAAPITFDMLSLIAGPAAEDDILEGIVDNVSVIVDAGLAPPHRLAHFLAQTAHESARFSTTEEFASGAAYEGRTDLGNVEPGDGKRFKGRGLIQTTGRANYVAFTAWAAHHVPDAANFLARPALLVDFPWALLSAIFYWQSNNLSRYADIGDIEMLTRRINGGLNGFDDRCALYARAALVLLGYAPDGTRAFQRAAGLLTDGIAGPRTRATLHVQLKRLLPAASSAPESSPPPAEKPILTPSLETAIRRIVQEELRNA